VTTSQTDPMIGRLLDGRYAVRSRIARGGMATVYVATDLRLERRVAIKVMHGHLADDAVFTERFIQEARSAARLAHPNVVNVFDQGQDADSAYLVMEYLQGMTLRDLLQEYKTLTPEQTMDIMEAVLSGLAAAHKAGIVHRDLKPENVLLADDGRIKIGDFGLARAVSANTATGQALLGTIAYLSPELVTRGVADTRSDIYAVGIMMYEMLAGAQPFVGDQPMQIAYQHANDTVPTPSSANPSVPVELDELVLWATARDPEQRPRDAGAMLDQLFEAQTLMEVHGARPTAPQRTMVLPPALGPEIDSTAETQVIGGTGPAVPEERDDEPELAPSSQALATKTRSRRRRGFWLFALVLLLTGAAGGTGWYFSSGPGAAIAVPDVANLDAASAQSQLEQSGFLVTVENATDPAVGAGAAIGTDPPAGSPLQSGEGVSLIVSSGPRAVPVGEYKDRTEDEVREQFVDFEVLDDTISQFSDVAEGNVIVALDGAGAELGQTYPERRPVQLVVSVGPIPDVVGQPVGVASANLDAAGLMAVPGDEVFSDTITAGSVTAVTPETDPVRVGDSVTLTVSKGPDLVEVPELIGLTRDEAKAAVAAAGFVVRYSAFWDALPNQLTEVVSASPDPGSMQRRGSTINLAITASG
jgi:serine/threonine protein kinase/beta-lactam-binding protein with PASTA domain